MSITVIKPGLQSSFQDLGRHGHQHLGIPVGGAMDTRAHRLANLFAGNTEDQATLEITLSGPTLQFNSAACIAISGALLAPTLNSQPVPNNRPLIVRAGDTLSFGARSTGLRAYLAVSGGFDMAPVMGSRSTYMRGGFGGLDGRALQRGDTLTLRQTLPQTASLSCLSNAVWGLRIYLPAILGAALRTDIRAVRGPHDTLFTPESLQALFSTRYQVSAQSERMGYRLAGAELKQADTRQLLSEATSFGTIQVPPDGNPIILMADRQTTGGYAKIAHVCTVDLPLVAQTMPGQTLTFHEITLEQAQQLDQQREAAFDRLHSDLASLREQLDHYRNKL